MFNSSTLQRHIIAGSGCEHTVYNMVINTRKKCAQLSTDYANSLQQAWSTWTTTHLIMWFSTAISPMLSTQKIALITSVTSTVMPTFHSTYYYNNRFYRKDF